ncbi:hypothetical protein ASPVEDRAFT_40303 [Aspergillus versicolor CBS 583.65]|uniref:Uncharacterized protein n=1 Tax=Aspergillus versicolor CBS 583.65 TaxID=1036611 RepID=A0A1L9PH44_ASPVE|nr:uncharacterized protein ASPVEDRAFT_40303 [Aspergillus versicolor CBS 583.65]OJJ00776.1 hypothetical protein ASPVEDRAFT_40303 [Aspergillus versicolor CBS 583.65]
MFGACTTEGADSGNLSQGGFRSYTRQYSPDATIVLIGFPRAGKRTLGIIASVSLRRRFVDFDAVFKEHFDLSPQEYIAANGMAQYRTVEGQLSQELLSKCGKGCVIVGLGGVASQQQQTLLQQFAQDHPVIYIRRADSALRQLVTTSEDKFERYRQVGKAFFEACSNFEFFNLEESRPSTRVPSSLKLKDTERVFVRFLNRIFGHNDSPLFSSDAFSPSHTFALQIPAPWLDSDPDLEALDAGADAISLVVDLDTVDKTGPIHHLARYVAILRMSSRIPIVMDIRTTDQHLDLYTDLLQMVLRLAPDAITCSINHNSSAIQTLNNIKGHTKKIATYHQAITLGWKGELPEIDTLPRMAQELGFECIRITGESALSADNLSCIALRQAVLQNSSISVIMYNTGILGRTSVCLNPILSPVMIPGYDGLGVTLSEAQKALTACFLNPKKHFTIVGQAVQHSLSPAMHNAAYSSCGLPHVYDALQANTLSDIRPILDDETYGGIAVSLPYKTAVLEYLDEINPDARDINAVNTVVLERQHQPDGSGKSIRKGYNTDYIGIRNCIYNHLSPANTIREGTTALIIGAGGMARAAIYACYQLGIRQICIDNRTVNNAQKLAAYYHQWAKAKFGTEFQLEVIRSVDDPWPVYMRLPTIVISCLPAQKIGSESLIDIRVSEKWLQSTTGGVFLEVAYGPCKTPLLEQMLEHTSTGWVVVDGLNLLVEQGIAQYELFTKRPAPVHVMRKVIQEEAAKHGYFHQ